MFLYNFKIYIYGQFKKGSYKWSKHHGTDYWDDHTLSEKYEMNIQDNAYVPLNYSATTIRLKTIVVLPDLQG